MKKPRKHKAQQFEMPITRDAFNLEQETTPAPKDNKGRVYVIEARRGDESWIAFGGMKMTRDMAELTVQHCRQIWPEVSYTIKDSTQ